MRKLILIKHASPLVIPGTPPEQWKLSDKGRESCVALAEALREHAPSLFVSSEEPKAQETAELTAGQLGAAFETAKDLHEHDRSNVPHMRSGEFISHMEVFFRKRDERVLGKETARDAEDRFADAIDAVLKKHPQGNVAIVAHGTVIALFLTRHGGKKPFELWREMGLPSFAVLTVPGMQIESVIRRVG
jgi:broad specificity phosphatase PhoE